MKKVLILCDYFPPHSGPRMGYLVKYLSRLGWESYVVAGELSLRGGFEALTGFAKEVHIIPQKPHRKWNLLHILPFFWPYDYLRGEYDMLSTARKIVRKHKIDVVLVSCTFGMFPCNTANRIARKHKIPLIIDVRDLLAQEPQTSFWRLPLCEKVNRMRQRLGLISQWRFNRIFKNAAALVSVSPWHVQWLEEHFKTRTDLIYNGYDPELFYPVTPREEKKFQIVYTGTLGYKFGRDYTYLLESVKRLHEKRMIAPETFEVKLFCGRIPKGNMICAEIENMGLSEYFSFLPFVPAQDIPPILSSASMLLVLTSKNGFHGIMTTKFFEYLAVNRPVLCVTSDEELLEMAIDMSQAGCAARTVEEAEAFIAEKYEEWLRNGCVAGTVKRDAILKYSREVQAEQFARLFEDVITGCSKEG